MPAFAQARARDGSSSVSNKITRMPTSIEAEHLPADSGFDPPCLRHLFAYHQPSVPTSISAGLAQVQPQTPPRPKLPSLHDFFSPTGLLSRSSLAFEHRPGQYEMAQAVESALNDKRHLVVEAGTGTGKTLAYLLPALRFARQQGQRVIVSTGTKNLQETALLQGHPLPRVPPESKGRRRQLRPPARLLHERPRQLPLPAQALRPPRLPTPLRPRRN